MSNSQIAQQTLMAMSL